MFGKKEAEIARLNKIVPYAEDAQAIHDEVAHLMEKPSNFTTSQIAQRAFENIRSLRFKEAEDILYDYYVHEHTEELFARVLEDVRKIDGDRIAAAAKLAVETDPEVAVAARDNAFTVLGAEAAQEVIRDSITTQQAAIDQEKERLIALNRLDVELQLTGKLDISTERVKKLLQHGDRLSMKFITPQDKDGELNLRWYEAGVTEREKGWVYDGASENLFSETGGYSLDNEIKGTQFVIVAMVGSNMETGSQQYSWDTLEIGLPIALDQGRLFHIHNKVGPIRLSGCDFQTKNMRFFGTQASDTRTNESPSDNYDEEQG